MSRHDLHELSPSPDQPWPEIEDPPEPFSDDWWYMICRRDIHRARRRYRRRLGFPGDYSDLDWR